MDTPWQSARALSQSQEKQTLPPTHTSSPLVGCSCAWIASLGPLSHPGWVASLCLSSHICKMGVTAALTPQLACLVRTKQATMSSRMLGLQARHRNKP